MRTHGDIPSNHRMIIEELTRLEQWFYAHESELPILKIAKGFVCMSYDYFGMYMEEEGLRLLLQAEKYCPGYFSAPILVHTDEDPDYFYLVEGLKTTLALDIMKSLGFRA